MKGNPFIRGLVSTTFIFVLAQGAQAFPPWMKPRRDADSKNAPRQYSVYESPASQSGGSYTYPGIGPQPTIASSSSYATAASQASGEETSLSISSSRKLPPH
jgi:hypothetical protein